MRLCPRPPPAVSRHNSKSCVLAALGAVAEPAQAAPAQQSACSMCSPMFPQGSQVLLYLKSPTDLESSSRGDRLPPRESCIEQGARGVKVGVTFSGFVCILTNSYMCLSARRRQHGEEAGRRKKQVVFRHPISQLSCIYRDQDCFPFGFGYHPFVTGPRDDLVISTCKGGGWARLSGVFPSRADASLERSNKDRGKVGIVSGASGNRWTRTEVLAGSKSHTHQAAYRRILVSRPGHHSETPQATRPKPSRKPSRASRNLASISNVSYH